MHPSMLICMVLLVSDAGDVITLKACRGRRYGIIGTLGLLMHTLYVAGFEG